MQKILKGTSTIFIRYNHMNRYHIKSVNWSLSRVVNKFAHKINILVQRVRN